MGKIAIFNHVTVDGYFAVPNGEIDWFKCIARDEEWDAYTHQQSGSGGTLMFGQTTYEMMQNYWPTSRARMNDPAMAAAVNLTPKIVFSTTLKGVEEGPNWKNIRIFNKIDRMEIMELKDQEKGDITIPGSGTIVQQLTKLRLVDEYSLVVVPVILGAGKSMFNDVDRLPLKLIEARSFKNGIVLQRYTPA
jgi:dihydrofolate reductase